MSIIREKIEILSPAGSFESFRAVITAGADAVYAGGQRFGARAFAENFSPQELLEAIDYAHLHGKRFYLTVNTLLKDEEMEELYDYLAPLYRQGLDAVIVQDIGVLSFVREHFPDMEVHASTQMTITGADGARFLKELGVKRVVPARELSLPEIAQIREKTGLDVECFVHGALCYCYSGQCLLSSFIGGRSGNRGQCAQPCRLPYAAGREKGYLLSLKDICTLEMIPKMAQAGINSFKIEGRMKKPEYVALVTAMYRKYLDLYLEKGEEGFHVESKDLERLKDIYNRGGFHTGYYEKHNGRDMLSLGRPNHAGVPAVRVLAQKGREVTGTALTEIHKGDILELSCKNKKNTDNYTFGKGAEKGKTVTFLAPKNYFYKKGTLLNRVRSQHLLDETDRAYVSAKKTEEIEGTFTLHAGSPAALEVCYSGVRVRVQTELSAEEAQKKPLGKKETEEQLRKTGNTEFFFGRLEMDMEESVFLPMQEIKKLRRAALEELKEAVCRAYRRREDTTERKQANQAQDELQVDGQSQVRDIFASGEQSQMRDVFAGGEQLYVEKMPSVSVLAETREQLFAVEEFTELTADTGEKVPFLSRVYVDCQMDGEILPRQDIRDLCRRLKERGKEVYCALPAIFRSEAAELLKREYTSFEAFAFDGVLVRNYEEIRFLRDQKFDRPVILDHNLYVCNQKGKQFWQSQGVETFTAPVELNRRELDRLGLEHAELVVYGHLPVMVSAQCIAKTVEGCRKDSRVRMLKDRLGNQLPVRNYCGLCYNIIYNTSALCLADLTEDIRELSPAAVRLWFTVESRDTCLEVLKFVQKEWEENTGADREEKVLAFREAGYTRGHFKRGIT